jgi:NAD+ synthase (glutamine-hydrolysing)
MLKIALAQLNYHIGNFESNTAKIIEAIESAKRSGADLIVFAELAVCGYPARDFLESDEFIDRCEQAVATIAESCAGIACILGLPTRNPSKEGKNLHNAAYLIENRQVTAVVHKALLPTYDVFDEYRYFQPASTFQCIQVKGHRIALTICEDLWNQKDDPLYISSPMDTLISESPELMINIAASPFSYTHDEERIRVLAGNCRAYSLPLLYVNQVGAHTEIIFDGGSMAFSERGELLHEMAYFREDLRVFEFSGGELQGLKPVVHDEQTAVQQIHDALILGIRDYFRKSGFTKAVLGLSGGIDSALVCALATEALGPGNVLGVLMPSEFSSDHSVSDALALAKNLGCRHEIVPIKEAAAAYNRMLEPAFRGLPFNVTEENIQARCRAIVVMAFSNKFGYILLNTSNKSECAVGYGTLYGDMAGAISVLGDVYKTQVYQLCRYINRNGEIIPENTIAKPPSAELRPGQKDSDSLPDYDLLDKILFRYIELRQSSHEIIAAGFEEATVKRVLKLINAAEFKRYQTPPILRVSSKAFGMGRRMPIVGKYLS